MSLYKAPSTNYVTTTLNGAINDSVNTFTLNSTTNLQAPGYIVIDREDGNGTATPTSREVISFTGVSGSDLTGCTRGADGSTARSHNDGALVETIMTAGMWNDLGNNIITSSASITALAVGTMIASNASVNVFNANTLNTGTLDTDNFYVSQASIGFLNTKILHVSGASINQILDEDTMSTNSDVALATQQSIKAYVDSTATGGTGWTEDTTTWTYASATTFTIAGADETTQFSKGTRIRYKQGGGYQYATVASSTFSTNTTVTLIGNTDYALASAAITDTAYSYQANPQGYPAYFTYTPAAVGFSSTSVLTGRFTVLGNAIWVQQQVQGTSDTTGLTLSLPVDAIVLASGGYYGTAGYSQDNGSALTTPASIFIETALGVATYGKDMTNAAWTNSGTKLVRGSLFYKF